MISPANPPQLFHMLIAKKVKKREKEKEGSKVPDVYKRGIFSGSFLAAFFENFALYHTYVNIYQSLLKKAINVEH